MSHRPRKPSPANRPPQGAARAGGPHTLALTGARPPAPGRPAGPRQSDALPAGQPTDGTRPTRPSEGTRPTRPPEGTRPTRPPEGTRPTRPPEGTRPTRPPESTRPARHDAPYGADRQRHGQDAPRGTVWLYGLHAVAAALANPHRRARRLVLTEEAEAALAKETPHPWPISAERMERARLDQLIGRDAVHQGAALLADPLSPPSLAAMLERPGAVLVLDQVADPRNVGAILRIAAAFAAAGVIVQDRHAPDETGALAKAASGALETVPMLRAVNIARTIAALKAAGRWVIGLDASGAALRGSSLAERRVALVLGAEGEGLRRLTRETCDELAGLPMPGSMESLNVSAAAAVALYELARPS